MIFELLHIAYVYVTLKCRHMHTLIIEKVFFKGNLSQKKRYTND